MLHIQFLIVEASSHGRSVSPSTVLTSRDFWLLFSQNTSQNLSTVLSSPPNYCQFLPFLSDPVLSPCPCSVHSGLSSDSWITWALLSEERLMDLWVYKHWNNIHTLNSHSATELIISELRSRSTLRGTMTLHPFTADYSNITNKR